MAQLEPKEIKLKGSRRLAITIEDPKNKIYTGRKKIKIDGNHIRLLIEPDITRRRKVIRAFARKLILTKDKLTKYFELELKK